jgi:hypothetical protein
MTVARETIAATIKPRMTSIPQIEQNRCLEYPEIGQIMNRSSPDLTYLGLPGYSVRLVPRQAESWA